MKPFTIRDGSVFRGDIHMTPDECDRLLSVYRRDAKAGDWWSPFARQRAGELAAVMAEAYHRTERAA